MREQEQEQEREQEQGRSPTTRQREAEERAEALAAEVLRELGSAPDPAGLVVVLAGFAPRRTGFAAALVAQHLGTSVDAIDLSQVVSRFVGETERILSALLERAEAGGSILLLDEADDLFDRSGATEDDGGAAARAEVAEAVLRLLARPPVPVLLATRRQVPPPEGRRHARVFRLPTA
jgi:SpoVK/Ycf46/Vps4 family AAA+-type ATPase